MGKKITSIFMLLILLASCRSSCMMTMSCYCDISLGMSEAALVKKVGSPYSTCKKTDGSIQYEYIERLKLGERYLEQRHYYIVLKNNKVISKKMESVSPPPWIYNSYDYQTSKNENNN